MGAGDEQKLNALGRHVTALYRGSIRTKAKLKALETLIRHRVPKNEFSAWDAAIKKLTQKFLQELLEAHEKRDPGFAAWIDDRKGDETNALE
jgi:hypothetical protein